MCHGQIINTQLLAARKQHRCTECKRPIKQGEKHIRQAMAIDGAVDAWRTCERCYALSVHSESNDGECVVIGETREYIRGRGTRWQDLRRFLRDQITQLRVRLGHDRQAE